MGKVTFRTLAGTDGSLQLPSGFRHLFAHGITTVLLLVTLMAAAWHFMDWMVAPSACLIDSSQSSATSSSATSSSAPAPPEITSPVAPRSTQAGGSRGSFSRPEDSPTTPSELPSSVSPPPSYQYSARVEMALNKSSECSCPQRAGTQAVRTPRDSAGPRPAPGAGTSATRSPS
jgi:hypothetical protein